MSRLELYPLHFNPILKRLIWGGRRLESVLGKELPEGENYAESWEIADHRNDVSHVAEGPLQGSSLRDLIAAEPRALLGDHRSDGTHFPLLIKFLDAHQVLSVQVHPDDTLAARLANDRGKTEAWVVLHAEPGSLIYAGLKPSVSRADFAQAVEHNNVPSLLHSFTPKVGDCVFVPAGTVHALGAGLVVAEIQQMSDATFRIHDWGRLGSDGRPRALHLAEAIESIDFERGPVSPVVPRRIDGTRNFERQRLVQCTYFDLDRIEFRQRVEVGSTDSFTILIGLDGSTQVRSRGAEYPLARGKTLLLPAALGPCELHSAKMGTLLIISVPR